MQKVEIFIRVRFFYDKGMSQLRMLNKLFIAGKRAYRFSELHDTMKYLVVIYLLFLVTYVTSQPLSRFGISNTGGFAMRSCHDLRVPG